MPGTSFCVLCLIATVLLERGAEAEASQTGGVGTVLCSKFHPQGDDSKEIRLCVLDYRGDLLRVVLLPLEMFAVSECAARVSK